MNILALVNNVLFRSDNTPKVLAQAGFTLLRVVAGLAMIHNGLDKLEDIEGFAEAYVQVIGLPFPIFFSYVAALTELLGAPLLMLGLFTRPAALGLTSTMLVAMYHHILVGGFNIAYLELSMIYASVFAFYAINGGGLFSVDTLISGLVHKLAGTTPVAQDAIVAAPIQQDEQTLEPVGAAKERATWGSYLR
ncbi:MAG: DoxX family protein [Oscillatoriales cyanobacterium SM2_2_1]|nr:DoxX family protein [Oscillatoriales cyanobacterium SM2_2_1]